MRFRILFIILGVVFLQNVVSGFVQAYDYGDYRSETLVARSWKALKDNDIEGVIAYTNKCLELYANEAKKMQISLTDYPTGSQDVIFGYWALNDVATALFIQGEAYRNVDGIEKATSAYQQLVNEYSYGQCWDPKGQFFWKPGEAAQEKLNMLASGSNLDFGDYSSETLTVKAWKALEADDIDAVLAYTKKCIELYAEKAQEMQSSLTEYPTSDEKIFFYWALNDVGTSLYIQGKAYQKAGQAEEAKKAFQQLVDVYSYAQCYDPSGPFFWKPAEAVKKELEA